MPPGAYGTTVQGGLAEGETRSYGLHAEAGQQLVVKLVTLDESVHLKISDEQGVSLLGDLPETVKIRNLDLVLPKTGDYQLQVCAETGRCSYMLEVTLDDPPKPKPKPKARIKDSPSEEEPDEFRKSEPSPLELFPAEPEEHPSKADL